MVTIRTLILHHFLPSEQKCGKKCRINLPAKIDSVEGPTSSLDATNAVWNAYEKNKESLFVDSKIFTPKRRPWLIYAVNISQQPFSTLLTRAREAIEGKETIDMNDPQFIDYDSVKDGPVQMVVVMSEMNGHPEEEAALQHKRRDENRDHTLHDIESPSIVAMHGNNPFKRRKRMASGEGGEAETIWAIADPASQNHIPDGRPQSTSLLLDVSLLSEALGKFQDQALGFTDIDDLWRWSDSVERFVLAASDFYEDEAARREALIPVIRDIFNVVRPHDGMCHLYANVTDKPNPAGHELTAAGRPICIVELENDPMFQSGYPEYQGAKYLERLGMRTHEKEVVPALVIAIVGSQISFYSAVVVGSYARLCMASHTYLCLPDGPHERRRPGEPKYVWRDLRRVFAAASILTHDLSIEGKQRDSPHYNHPAESLLQYQLALPYPRKVFRVNEDGTIDKGKPIHFKIIGPRMKKSTLLFPVETNDGQKFLVKFTREYCLSLHHFCWQRKHAPALVGYDEIPGGWKVILMEELDGVPLTANHISTLRPQILDLVKSIHRQGYVHGDLRAVNILEGKNGQFWLIDFDWGGLIGIDDDYPTIALHPDLIPEGADKGRITTEHDLAVLEKTFESLRLSARTVYAFIS